MINPSFWLEWHKSVIKAAPMIADFYYQGNYYIQGNRGHLSCITGGKDIPLHESIMLIHEDYGLIGIKGLQ